MPHADHAAQAAAKRFSRLLDSGWLLSQLQRWRLQAVQVTRPQGTQAHLNWRGCASASLPGAHRLKD